MKEGDQKPNHNRDCNEQMAAGFLRKGRKARSIRLTTTLIAFVMRDVRRENHQLAPERHTDILPCPSGSECSERQPIHGVLS